MVQIVKNKPKKKREYKIIIKYYVFIKNNILNIISLSLEKNNFKTNVF